MKSFDLPLLSLLTVRLEIDLCYTFDSFVLWAGRQAGGSFEPQPGGRLDCPWKYTGGG